MWAEEENGEGFGASKKRKADWSGGGNDQDWQWGIQGFKDVLVEALEPVKEEEVTWSFEELQKRVGQKIVKAAKKFRNDERLSQKGSASVAQTLIEEFIDNALGAVSASVADRTWYPKMNLRGPLMAASIDLFKNAKVFSRTLGPTFESQVDEGIFKYNEEERIQNAVPEAVRQSGVKDSHQKKAIQLVLKAYDDAHFKAPYGSTDAEAPAMAMLQDFVKGWIYEFSGRAWDIMENGLATSGATGRDQQILFITVLFQHLTAPDNAVLPHDLTTLIETPPPNPWPFVAETAEAVFSEQDQAEQVAAERKEILRSKGKGKQRMLGFGKGDGGLMGKGASIFA